MGFRINTNIAAMNAHRNSVQTNWGLDKSLQSLSSGLRINKAADDASGMTIADSLKSQALGLGQAIMNANDGVSVVQVADGALDEYINIINTVRTKAIQAASDGQSTDSRKAIQADIDRLLEEAQTIATTTQFNGQKLLDGSYTQKAFHIGAYANETANFSIGNTQTSEVGGLNNAVDNSTYATAISNTASGIKGSTETGAYILDSVLTINGTDVTDTLNTNYATRLLDASSVAAAISDSTDVHAVATNSMVASGAVAAATISGSSTNYLKINGVDIGEVKVEAKDASRSLTTAINSVSELTGVTASVDDNGVMTLTSVDGRNISIDAKGTGLNANLKSNVTTVSSNTNTLINGTSTSAVTLQAGELVINGVDLAGTYGTSGVASSARAELEAAIKSIAGLEDSKISSNGQIQLKNNTGIDINVVDNSSQIDFAATATGIFNKSDKGEVTLYSNGPIEIDTVVDDTGTTEYNKLVGFKNGVLRTAQGKDSLDTIDVTTRRGAELAIKIADAALKALDATRSDLGSVQNQLESTIRNISVTQVNVTAAESQIRDVDFAKESANFAKLNILAQSGSYALSQANAIQQNVLRLLQ